MRVWLELGALVGIVGLTTACGLTEKGFLKKLYKEKCAYEFSCYGEAAGTSWGSEDACRDAYEPVVDDGLEFFDGCKYDSKEAKDCLKVMKDAECGPTGQAAITTSCDVTTIWQCTEDGEQGACTPAEDCCDVCESDESACGDECIPAGDTCEDGAGCACNVLDVCV